MSSFGERFKSIRVKKGLTQDELANEFNDKYGFAISKATVSHYENNRRVPEMNTIRKLAEYLDVSLDYLLCNDLGVIKEGAEKYLNKGPGQYIELSEVIMLIKSLAADDLIRRNNEVISKAQKSILCNGIDVINGLIDKS